jgi:hypothetical protein
MRGGPLIEWLVFAAVWILLLVPLWKVTAGHNVPVSGSQGGTAVEQGGAAPVWVRLKFSEPPTAFKIHAGGEAVWSETGPGNEMEQLLTLESGAGLELEAEWPDAGRRAVELVVSPVEGATWRRVVWTDAQVLRESLVPE